jgi:carbon-monoxide dehydrogenase medium subunit
MLLPRFEYLSPRDRREALTFLSETGRRTVVLAGGTDLLPAMKQKQIQPSRVLSLDRMDDLDGVSRENGFYKIGGRVTAAFLSQNPGVKKGMAALADAAGQLGSPLIRNRATIGGNLANARPAADLAPPLLALGARVELESRDGVRRLDLNGFFQGPGQTLIRPSELLTAIFVPLEEPGEGSAFIKLGRRAALERSMASVAAYLALEPDGRTIRTARVALGAAAPVPLRSPRAEAVLTGGAAAEALFSQAGQAAMEDACPRGRCTSADYTRQMAAVLCRRALALALQRARE